MSVMAALIACMSAAPVSAAVRACRASSLALVAFSAFRLVMPAISSRDALVSSRDAACSLAPCASDWLEEETWVAAVVTWVAPSPRVEAIASRRLVTVRPPIRATAMKSTVATTRMPEAPVLKRLD